MANSILILGAVETGKSKLIDLLNGGARYGTTLNIDIGKDDLVALRFVDGICDNADKQRRLQHMKDAKAVIFAFDVNDVTSLSVIEKTFHPELTEMNSDIRIVLVGIKYREMEASSQLESVLPAAAKGVARRLNAIELFNLSDDNESDTIVRILLSIARAVA